MQEARLPDHIEYLDDGQIMLIKPNKQGRRAKNKPKKKQTDVFISSPAQQPIRDYDDELELMNERFSKAKLQSSEKKPQF